MKPQTFKITTLVFIGVLFLIASSAYAETAEEYYNRGLVYCREDNFTQAITEFARALEINPHLVEAYINRVSVYYVIKEYNNAWIDVHKVEMLGYAVNPGLLKELKKASGKDK